MIIDIEKESIYCNSFDQYEAQVRKILDLKSAEVWISENGGQDDLPCLSILINDGEYVINYFGDDGSNYVTVGLEGDEREVPFCDGQYDVAGYQIISREEALTAIIDFFNTHEPSDEINWEEL